MPNIPGHSRTRSSHNRVRRATHDYDAQFSVQQGATEMAEQDAIDRVVNEQDLAPGSLTIGKYAQTLRPVAIVEALPTLPSDDYPVSSYVVLSTTGRLYKNVADAWVLGVNGADIVADSITAAQIEAGAISTSELAVGATIRNVDNLGGGTGTVIIDSSGILIKNGVLTLQDEFGSSVLFSSGFTGAWFDFVNLGLYNARFLFGVVGALPASGRTASLPYWDIAEITGNPTATLQSTGGVRVTFAGITDDWRIDSDLVPCIAGERYSVHTMCTRFVGGGASSPNYSSSIRWHDSAGTFISSTNFSLNATDDSQPVFGTAPATARFCKVRMNVGQSALHHASSYMQLDSVSLVRITQPNLTGLDLITNNHNTGIETAQDVIIAGRLKMTGVVSPTLSANANDWSLDITTSTLIRVGSDATIRTITGLGAGDDGQVMWMYNRNAGTNVLIAHESASSLAANRFHCRDAVTYTLTPKSSCRFIYSTTDARWLLLG